MKIIHHKNKILLLSGLISLVFVVSLALFGLKLSIDFSGGSLYKYKVDGSEYDNAYAQISEVMNRSGIEVVSHTFEDELLVIRTKFVSTEQNALLSQGLIEDYPVELDTFTSVGSVIGQETIDKSLKALLISFIGILIYITYAFKDIPSGYSSYKFGVSALIAMVFDVISVFGVFALLGRFLNVEIDVFFVTAILTTIGFSVNDTIVVFDRFRENLNKNKKSRDLVNLANNAINETLRRSIGTSLTVLFVLFALFFFGGHSIKYFVLALIVGVISGTYSSIFVATPVFVTWESYKK